MYCFFSPKYAKTEWPGFIPSNIGQYAETPRQGQ